MADLASFRIKYSDAPSIINLDMIATIEALDHGDGPDGLAHIVFRRVVELATDEGGGTKPWYKQPDSALVTWTLSVANTGLPFSDVKELRERILSELIDGKREFLVDSMPGKMVIR